MTITCSSAVSDLWPRCVSVCSPPSSFRWPTFCPHTSSSSRGQSRTHPRHLALASVSARPRRQWRVPRGVLRRLATQILPPSTSWHLPSHTQQSRSAPTTSADMITMTTTTPLASAWQVTTPWNAAQRQSEPGERHPSEHGFLISKTHRTSRGHRESKAGTLRAKMTMSTSVFCWVSHLVASLDPRSFFFISQLAFTVTVASYQLVAYHQARTQGHDSQTTSETQCPNSHASHCPCFQEITGLVPLSQWQPTSPCTSL